MSLGNNEGTFRYRCPMNIRIKILVVSVDNDASWTILAAPLYQPSIYFPEGTGTGYHPIARSITYAVLFPASSINTNATSTYFICDDWTPELTRLRGDYISMTMPQIGGREAHIQLLGYQIPGDDGDSEFI